MKMFYNVVNSIICCAKEARASIVLQWAHFVLQNCENFKLHSVRGLYDKKQRLIVLFTSDVMYKKYKRLLYTPLDLLARFFTNRGYCMLKWDLSLLLLRSVFCS